MRSARHRAARIAVLVLLAGLPGGAFSLADGDTNTIGYRRDILPLLSDRCFKCHGPDSASREAGLRLDQREAATAVLDSGMTAVVPGDAARSALIERIESSDPALSMPPADSGKFLSPTEKALLRRWIEQGGEYEPHWAFVGPVRPLVPETESTESIANPIDAFVLKRLAETGLKSAPRASKERLIRRVYFDLIGLPPNIEEIDAFLADGSPDAYARLVDRLMQSPHYGERMAADWLDGARYADSNGYQNDFARSMWPWRDWVIKAFQSHMRYDQFVLEQLAGDLLPNATLEQRIATGFNRNHRTVTEAGSIEEEWLVENVVDRVETAGTALLGLTVGCARCHDHKYDPISQREFYQLFAFFNNVNEKGVYTETRGNVAPLVKVTTVDDEKKLAEFDARIVALTQKLTERMAGIAPLRQQWVETLKATEESAEPAATVAIDLRKATAARVANSDKEVAVDADSVEPPWSGELFGETAAFDGKQHLAYSMLNFPPGDQPFSWAVWVKPGTDGAILSKMDSQSAARGADLYLFANGKLAVHLINEWPANALKVILQTPIARDRWSHIVATYDGSKKAAGVAIYVNGNRQQLVTEVDQLSGSFHTEQPFRIGSRSTDGRLHAKVADVRLFPKALNDSDAEAVFSGSLRRGLENADASKLDEAILSQFDALLLAYSKDPAVKQIAETKQALETEQADRAKFDSAIPTTMVMEERAEPRETYLLQRGRYDLPEKTERLVPDTPAVFPAFPADGPRNRLGLARWVISVDNPLTARVAVNRLWQQFFGLGLVKTPENFGVQSEPPSHPELLDWLATEFVRSGWDLQHIQRLIVSSRTYQQQSEAAPELCQRDPENRLLARGPRHRLSAESIRDNALALSGLLVRRIGGPSVMPYQPEGLWEELAGGAFEVYVQGHGDDLYRRSLYVYRKRTVPHPSMSTFDAPSWEICQVKRPTTNTPLQALALLNDVTYVEAARKFAERMLTSGGSTPDERLTFGFRSATGRSPSPAEISKLRSSLEKHLVRFTASPEAANEFISHGESPRDTSLNPVELAAHTAIAGMLINLDEALSKN